MRDRILSIGSGVLTGTSTFIGTASSSNIIIDLCLAVSVAFLTGLVAYAGNETGRCLKRKFLKNKSHGKTK